MAATEISSPVAPVVGEAISVTHDRQQRAKGGRLRRCPECGTPTTGRWCSARCHRADEPGAYGGESDA